MVMCENDVDMVLVFVMKEEKGKREETLADVVGIYKVLWTRRGKNGRQSYDSLASYGEINSLKQRKISD